MSAKRHNEADAAGASPERTCIVTRAVRAPADLIRFVVSPTGEVVPDLAQKLPGRGAWVSNSHSIVGAALKRGMFARAFRRKVNASPGLVDSIDRLFERRALDALSLANKSGCVVTGFTNVDQRLESGDELVLIQAHDASSDGRDRLARKFRAICSATGSEPLTVDLFSVEQISLAIGRTNVVHAAVNREAASRGFAEACGRLMQFRADDRPKVPAEAASEFGESPSEQANDVGRETEQV